MQSFSTFAGNPYYIDLEVLTNEGLITEEECDEYDFGQDETKVNYEALYRNKFKILRKAFKRFHKSNEYEQFLERNEEWLTDYCMYMAIKDSQNGVSWIQWPEEYRDRDEAAMANFFTNRSHNVCNY